MSKKKTLCILLGAVSLSGIVNIIVKRIYSSNPGLPIELHFWENVYAYSHYTIYLSKEVTYGVIGPAHSSVIYLCIFFIFYQIWKKTPLNLKQHILLVACINLPLFFTFCSKDELRNLSFFYASITILIGYLIDKKEKEYNFIKL